jgi:hypothetical protein
MLIILNGDRSGERFSLEPHQRYVIGRDKEAHFCLPEKKVSRQHAILTWNSDSSEVFLEDLNSLNGTIINGKPVTGLNLLKHDDRIQIGSFLLQVDFPQPSLEADSKQDSPKGLTAILEGLPPGAMESERDVEVAADASEDTGGRFLQGKLQEIPFADLLQMLSNMKKSGYLWISDRKLIRPPRLSQITDDVALIVMDAGEIQYAVCGEHENEEAIYSVLRRDQGFFALFPSGGEKFPSSMSMPVEALLLEGFRRLDEERAQARGLQPDDQFEVNPQESLLSLQPDELTIFQITWKHKTFARILQHSPVDEAKTRSILQKLVRSNFVQRL